MDDAPEYRGTHDQWVVIPAEPGNWEACGLLSERRVRRWALVLEARSVPFRIERDGMGWHLLVPAQHHAQACEELRLFEEENRNWPPSPPPDQRLADNTLATLSVLIVVGVFHNITLLDISLFRRHPDWMAIGSADASLILSGQWWRTVTSLTLHSDVVHLLGNLALGGIFIVWVCRELGSGLGWSLLLASGIIGNLANALIQGAGHRSVGASTLVFGGIGLLAGIGLLRYPGNLYRRRALPFAAAVALLALLGTEGARTDLGAHFCGFVSGIPLGCTAQFMVGRHGRPRPAISVVLATASAGVVLSAWWTAITFMEH